MNSVLNVTLADVKRAVGLLEDQTTYDKFLQERIDEMADLLIEDWFSTTELASLTPDQRRRAVLGIAYLLAGDSLIVMPVNAIMSSGNSISLGPISVAGWSGGGKMTDLNKVGKELRYKGEAILRNLRLTGVDEAIAWGAVGTRKHPTVIGGPKW